GRVSTRRSVPWLNPALGPRRAWSRTRASTSGGTGRPGSNSRTIRRRRTTSRSSMTGIVARPPGRGPARTRPPRDGPACPAGRMTEPAELPPGYPQEWEADVVLSDGMVAHVRPIRPDDTEAIHQFHAGQSDESIYLRFFAPIKRLSDKDVHRFTHVDYHDRVA